MLIFILILLIVSVLINGLLIFLLYHSYRLYLNEEMKIHMLKTMYDREECKSNDFSDCLNEDEYDFPKELRPIPKVPGEQIFLDYLTGKVLTEEEFEKRLKNRRKKQ